MYYKFYFLLCSLTVPSVTATIYEIFNKTRCRTLLLRRHGDPNYLSFWKLGLMSEKYQYSDCIFPMYTEKLEDKHLFLSGLYIAAHKYFVKDPRFPGENNRPKKPDFFKKFPSPEVSDLDPDLKKKCETNANACLQAIYKIAWNSGTIQQFLNLNLKLPAWAPFKTEYDAFVFRQTAMYYMCWYTMKRDPALIFKFKKPARIFQKDPTMRYDLDLTCHGYLYTAKEIEPASKRERLLKTRDKSELRDYRSKYRYMGKYPFLCAELWFCPDPCYPREEQGGFNLKRDLLQAGNPCRELPSPRCKIVPEANVNFRDLVSNRFNISCDCQSSKNGYFWSSLDNSCEDINECEDQSICPLGKTCHNTDGGYRCNCPEGSIENKLTTKCESVPGQLGQTNILPKDTHPDSSSIKRDGSVAFPADASGFEDSFLSVNSKKSSSNSGKTEDGPFETSQTGTIGKPPTPYLQPQVPSESFDNLNGNNVHKSDLPNPTLKPAEEKASRLAFRKGLPSGKKQSASGLPTSGGMQSRHVHKTSGSQRNKVEIYKSTETQSQEEVKEDDTGSFVSGFLGFVSAGGMNVPSLHTFVFGQVCFMVACDFIV